jgi:cleavage and polyadenylation specificity factor subunit 1
VKIAQLPEGFEYGELGWGIRKIQLGQEVQCIAYHEPMHSYIMATNSKTEFELPRDDDFHRKWAKEGMIFPSTLDVSNFVDITFKPLVDQSILRLMNPATWTFVDR